MDSQTTPFDFGELLAEDELTWMRHARRRSDHARFIVRLCKPTADSQLGQRALRREYQILTQLRVPGVIRAYGLEEADPSGPLLVLEDIGGVRLDRCSVQPLPVDQILSLASGLACTLADLHRQGVVHGAVTPAHIVFNPQNGAFRLIDFAHANQVVDQREDLVALGATLYQLLTGHLPFDPTRFAETPLAPHRVALPDPLARVVRKLMTTSAEERYQSGYGVYADLERCRAALTMPGEMPVFDLGQDDQDKPLHQLPVRFEHDADAEPIAPMEQVAAEPATSVQPMSGEGALGHLAETLLRITMENAEAEHGCLCLRGDDALVGDRLPGQEGIVFRREGRGTGAPKVIVDHVQRTRKAVVLRDAGADPSDLPLGARLLRTGLRSVLCLPIRHTETLIGVLYLENNRMAGVFTPQRCAMVELLVEQAAIALETASVYAALRESEAKYRRIVDTATEGIWVLDPEAVTTFVNSRLTSLLGYSSAEMIGRPASEFFFEKDISTQLQQIVSRQHDLAVGNEHRLRRRDGQEVWAQISASPVFDDAGEHKGALVTVTDISRRKQAERQLRLLSFAVGQVRDAVYLIDAEARIQYANDEACRMLGYSPRDFLGLRVADLDPDMSLERWHEHWQDLERRGVIILEAQHRTRDGRLIPVEVTANYLEFEGGAYNLALARDFSERRHAAEALQEQQRHAQALLRLSKRLQVVQTYDEIIGAAWDEVRAIVGYQNLWVYLLTDDREYAYSIGARGAVAGAVMSASVVAHLKIKGDRMLEEIAAARDFVVVEDARSDERTDKKLVAMLGNRTIVNVPILFHDRHLGTVGMGSFGDEGVRVPTPSERIFLGAVASHMAFTLDRVRLLNERTQAEDTVRKLNQELEQRVAARTAALEASNRDLESFSYSVSHDLRAPLRAITGFTQILAERYHDNLDEKGNHYLDNVLVASKRMTALIDDLLHYSRTGRGAVRVVPVPLAPLIGHLKSTFGDRITTLDAKLDVAEPLATPLADPVLIEQVLSNLVDNALTYRRPTGRTEIHLSAVQEGTWVVITVADNGIGIAPEYHEKIFQVFQRLHTDEAYPGTGIGLAIVAKAVRAMNGEIRVESALDRGSLFEIRLPAAERQEAFAP
mgnify:CR=1 FL=1